MPADSAKKVRFLRRKDELTSLIAVENLPDFLEGTASLEYDCLPTLERLRELYDKN